jgi:amidase
MPFSPSLDTVGVLAKNSDVLLRACATLVGSKLSSREKAVPEKVYVLNDAFALAGPEVRQALQSPLDGLRSVFSDCICQTSLGALCEDAQAADFSAWLNIYRILQGTEALSSLGAWVDEARPEFGPATQAGFEFIRSLDRTQVGLAVSRREHYFRLLRQAIGPRDLVCIPTAPAIAPLKGSVSYDRKGDYYQRTLSLTAIAGVGRLPQVYRLIAHRGAW